MKIFTCLIILLFVFSNHFVFSQNQPDAGKKDYFGEHGSLFINKTLPVYLWLSTSSDSTSEKFLLRSDTMPQYTNPMYFDTDGFNSIRTRGLVNNKTQGLVSAESDVFFPVYGDSRPPDSYTIIQSRYFKKKDNIRVYKNELIIDILSYDMFSGIQHIYYSINGQDYEIYEEQLKIEIEGDINLNYYAVDNVGNREEVKNIRFKIEK